MLPAGCTPIEVPLALDFSGGVSAASILDPAVGVFLRLGVACFVPMPLQNVIVASTALRANATAEVYAVSPVAQTDAVNTATGTCADVVAARRRALLGLGVGGLETLGEPGTRVRRLDSASSPPPLLEVGLEVLSCVVVSGDAGNAGVEAATAALVSRIAQLFNSTPGDASSGGGSGSGGGAVGGGGSGGGSGSGSVGNGGSGAGAGGVGSQFLQSFINAAANASGVPTSGVGVDVSGPITAHVVPKQSGGSSSVSAFPFVLVAAAAGGACLLGMLAILVLALLRRRKRRADAAALRATGKVQYEQRMHATNPMLRRGPSAVTKAGLSAAAAGAAIGSKGVGKGVRDVPMHGGSAGVVTKASNPMMRKVGGSGVDARVPGSTGAGAFAMSSNPMMHKGGGADAPMLGGGSGTFSALAFSSNPLARRKPPRPSMLLQPGPATSSSRVKHEFAAVLSADDAGPRRPDGSAAFAFTSNPLGRPRRAGDPAPRGKSVPAGPSFAAPGAAAGGVGRSEAMQYSSNPLMLSRRSGSMRDGASSTAAPSGSRASSSYSWSRSGSDEAGAQQGGVEARAAQGQRTPVKAAPRSANPYNVAGRRGPEDAAGGSDFSWSSNPSLGGAPVAATDPAPANSGRLLAAARVPRGSAALRSSSEGPAREAGGGEGGVDLSWASNPLRGGGPAASAPADAAASPQARARISVVMQSACSPFAAPGGHPSAAGAAMTPAHNIAGSELEWGGGNPMLRGGSTVREGGGALASAGWGGAAGGGEATWGGSNPMQPRSGGDGGAGSDSEGEGGSPGRAFQRRAAAGIGDELPDGAAGGGPRATAAGFAAGDQRVMWRSKRILHTGKSTKRVAVAVAGSGGAAAGGSPQAGSLAAV